MKDTINNKWLLFIVFFTCIPASQASELNFSIKENSELIVTSPSGNKAFKVNIYINGYNVNCIGDKVILWGRTKKINENNPQDSRIVLIDLKKEQTIKESNFSKSIFEVDYLSGQGTAYIGTGTGYLLDIDTGAVSNVNTANDFSDNRLFESCEKNKSWYFNRYNE
ncbi:hypothetical protein BADSM9389_02900 [Buttiauxella agrestis]|nr:hypothetical protein BADSM9389_02900 [Buttiauxella agrestis]